MQQHTDTGWAWVVLGASMGCNFLNGVFCYFVGVMHAGLLHKYQASVTTTAWVGSLYAANMALAAPLAALVVGRYGCRVCCITGGLLCFLGFLASAFAPSIAWLFLTYGMMAGLGLGLTYSPSLISISFYFCKYRGMATGLAVSFAALGILSGSLITQTLIQHYSVSGAFMLIAAISLHQCVFGAFFRPTQYELQSSGQVIRAGERHQQQDLGGGWNSKASRLSLALHGVDIRTVSQNSLHKLPKPGGWGVGRARTGPWSVTSLLRRAQANRHHQHVGNASSLAASVVSGDAFPSNNGDFIPSKTCSILLPRVDIVTVECEEICSPEQQDKLHFVCRPQGICPPADSILPELSYSHTVSRVPSPTLTTEILSGAFLDHISREDAFLVHHHHLHNGSASKAADTNTDIVRMQEEEDDTAAAASYCMLAPNSPCNETDVRSFASSREDVKPKENSTPESPRLRKTRLLKAMDSYLAVLTHTAFMCHCLSCLVANIHISGVYLHLPEYMLTKGTSTTQAATLFVAVGIFSLLSRLASGFASMDPHIECLTLNIGMMGLCGLATISFPFYSDTYGGQLVFAALFGLYTGGQYALISIMCVHFMGVPLLPTALGVQYFFMGVGYLSGPPLAALIVDSGGTYQHSFFCLGALMTLGSFLDMAAAYFSEPMITGEEVDRGGEAGEENIDGVEGGGVEDMGVAAMERSWLGSTIVISYQDTGNTHVMQHAGSSVLSLNSQSASRCQDVDS